MGILNRNGDPSGSHLAGGDQALPCSVGLAETRVRGLIGSATTPPELRLDQRVQQRSPDRRFIHLLHSRGIARVRCGLSSS